MPVIAIKDLQTQDPRNKTVLQQGMIYFRRAGQTKPVSGEECAAMMDRRDQMVRGSILGLLSTADQIGFENATIADFRKYGSKDENVTLWVPESAAKDLNIVDRAKLVESEGAPAYQIRGAVKFTTASDKDPRKPLLPKEAARALQRAIRDIFWDDFPWTHTHLKKAAEHLGFWPSKEGDETHTGYNELFQRPVYFEQGRAAIQRFATRNPGDFIDVVGSQDTKRRWCAQQRGG